MSEEAIDKTNKYLDLIELELDKAAKLVGLPSFKEFCEKRRCLH